MPKTLISTLILLAIALSVFISVALHVSSRDNKSDEISGNHPTPIPYLATSLSLLPNPLVITSGESASVDVTINPDTQPTLVQLEIGYDPNVLFDISILPGNYFADPAVVLEKYDTKNGRISYAVRCQPAADLDHCANSNESSVVTVNFSSLHFGSQKETKLLFLPKTSLKRNNENITLHDAKDATIILKPSFFAPIATPSGAIIGL